LSDEDQVVQANDDASPTKWHLAHTTWFFEAFVLTRFLQSYRVYDERFEYCFNSYYESVGPRHPRRMRGLLTRPSAADVRAYREHVDQALDRLCAGGGLPPEAASLIELGINHEQQHQELLLTDILSLFAAEPLKPAYAAADPALRASTPAPLDWIAFQGGVVPAGHDGDGFAYDNEGPRHDQLVRPFKLANRPVTNEEWAGFIEDGGYRTPTLWLADGWATVNAQGWEAPLYWERAKGGTMHKGGTRQMSLLGFRPIDPAAPVCHVSYYEADAFARWAGYRLPTEFEWELAADGLPVAGSTLGQKHLRPMAPALGRHGQLKQMFGDVWEWTASAHLPYPGFKAAPGAVGEYNGKFMCNQFVLRGGSCVTPDGHVRRSYRNFFYPHQRWQFMGLRLAADA
jgi:ergothioneine biosynthesis protein EgtB